MSAVVQKTCSSRHTVKSALIGCAFVVLLYFAKYVLFCLVADFQAHVCIWYSVTPSST